MTHLIRPTTTTISPALLLLTCARPAHTPCIRRQLSTHATGSSSSSSKTAVVYRPRRSFLYMPGSSQKMLSKIPALTTADTICMDLEDAVSDNKKQQARQMIVETLQQMQVHSQQYTGRSEICVRVNPVDSPYIADDITALLADNTQYMHTLVVPKVQSVDELNWICGQLDKYDTHQQVKLIVLIETCTGLINLPAICAARQPRLAACIFGGDDYAADIGATRSEGSEELAFARNMILTYCKAYNLQAIDIVNIDIKNTDALKAECEHGSSLGYTGKQLIHPSQIEVANTAFAPSQQRTAWAKELLEVAEKHRSEGVGAFTHNGQMIDMPTIKAAQRVMQRAEACEML